MPILYGVDAVRGVYPAGYGLDATSAPLETAACPKR
jgi:hypothetical protein